MDPALLDNVVKCLHLPKRGERRGGGGHYERLRRYYYSCLLCRPIKHAPLPRQGYYNQNDGLREEKKSGIREAKERRFPTMQSKRIKKEKRKTATNTAARRYNRVAGVSSFAAPNQRCASCSGHTGSRSRCCRNLGNPKGVPQDYG